MPFPLGRWVSFHRKCRRRLGDQRQSASTRRTKESHRVAHRVRHPLARGQGRTLPFLRAHACAITQRRRQRCEPGDEVPEQNVQWDL